MTRYKPEQIVTLLRQIVANGKTTPQACKEAQITAQIRERPWLLVKPNSDGMDLNRFDWAVLNSRHVQPAV